MKKPKTPERYEITIHGENIANEIQTEDAYGNYNDLNPADVYQIIDNLHTHFLDQSDTHPMLPLLEKWMHALTDTFAIEIP